MSRGYDVKNKNRIFANMWVDATVGIRRKRIRK